MNLLQFQFENNTIIKLRKFIKNTSKKNFSNLKIIKIENYQQENLEKILINLLFSNSIISKNYIIEGWMR
jgi:hypothetical protein